MRNLHSDLSAVMMTIAKKMNGTDAVCAHPNSSGINCKADNGVDGVKDSFDDSRCV